METSKIGVKVNNYNPDSWVVLKIKEGKYDKGFYKVLAGWSGGYLSGDSWRMNSGITGVEKQAYLYGFYGSSGSVYWCHQGSYRLTMAIAGVYNQLKENEVFEGQIQLMPEDTNWMEIEWYGSSQ
jgi:hypothetical protein